MSLRNTYLQSLLHETEDRLRQTSMELSELRAGIDEAVIVSTSTTRGEITHANPMMAKIAGYEPDELTGKTYRGSFNSNYHAPGISLENSGKRSRLAESGAARCGIRPKTDPFLLGSTRRSCLFVDEDGDVRQFMSVWRDITEQNTGSGARWNSNVQLARVRRPARLCRPIHIRHRSWKSATRSPPILLRAQMLLAAS